jgi:hypothetical protein
MHFTTSSLLATLLLASSAFAGPIAARNDKHDVNDHDMDDNFNIFKNSAER